MDALDDQQKRNRQLASMIKLLLTTGENPITCDDCFAEIDMYVEMIRAGEDAEAVLPHVKAHLNDCDCCNEEFRALVKILESQVGHPDE